MNFSFPWCTKGFFCAGMNNPRQNIDQQEANLSRHGSAANDQLPAAPVPQSMSGVDRQLVHVDYSNVTGQHEQSNSSLIYDDPGISSSNSNRIEDPNSSRTLRNMLSMNMLSIQESEIIGGQPAGRLLSDQAGVDFIKQQIGKTFDVEACRQELGMAESDKDAGAKPVPGYIPFLGRDHECGILLNDRDVELVKEGSRGYIASFSNGASQFRHKLMQEILAHSDKYEVFFAHSDPRSADHRTSDSKRRSLVNDTSSHYARLLLFTTCELLYKEQKDRKPHAPNLPELLKQFEAQMKSLGYHVTSQTALYALPKKYFSDAPKKIEHSLSPRHTGGMHSTSISAMTSRKHESIKGIGASHLEESKEESKEENKESRMMEKLVRSRGSASRKMQPIWR